MKNAKTAAEELEFCDKFSKVKYLENFAMMAAEVGRALKQIALHLEDRSEQNVGKPRNIMIDPQELIDIFIDVLPMEQMKDAETIIEDLINCNELSKAKHLEKFTKMAAEIGKAYNQIALHLEDRSEQIQYEAEEKGVEEG